ncbi:MAG: helix-turn-helix domain-containing protein [Clostridia bacterium]|nr:helix-turn-helix domain-containing protein [Clostridia bacterium]
MIGERLLTLRKRFGYSQECVAEKIGVSRQAVAKWESGETVPDLMNARALAELYDVTLDTLINGSEEAPGMLPPRGKHLFGLVTVGDKGQIVIPARCRKVFDIKPGDQLLVLGDDQQGIAILKQSFLMDMLRQLQQTGGDA